MWAPAAVISTLLVGVLGQDIQSLEVVQRGSLNVYRSKSCKDATVAQDILQAMQSLKFPRVRFPMTLNQFYTKYEHYNM